MTTPLLTTKLYIPPVRRNLVPRQRLIERLNSGFRSGHKLTLISAPAGFGKTTLVSEWVNALGSGRPPIAAAWLSLDEGDNDVARFLTYFVASLRVIEGQPERAGKIGTGMLKALQSPQPPLAEAVLISLINELATLSDHITVVLGDYHMIESSGVDEALAFLIEHLPPHLHLIIATRDDPHLPLARLRARGQLTELRANDNAVLFPVVGSTKVL